MITASDHTTAGAPPGADTAGAGGHTPKARGPTTTLNHALSKNEQIRADVEDCADALSAVNSALQVELQNHPLPSPMLRTALDQSDGVEVRVQECADELTTVNRALEAEVREREALELELHAARAQEEAARHAAFHDPLTLLPNRMLFNDRLEHGLAQAVRHARTLAVMFIDLDGFKAINDTQGHQAGDAVLKAVALRLGAMTREEDTLSRHGGDEFLYLLLELGSVNDAKLIAEKINQSINEPFLVSAGEGRLSLQIGASIGIAIFPVDGTTAASLIRSADQAMYRAKRGRSGYAFSQDPVCY
jgi:diguanylate cyclase